MCKPHHPILLIVTLMATIGCDDRATQIALEAADRQAQQNVEMSELNQHVLEGSRQLVTADAKARQEIVVVHRELQAERARLDGDWRVLEEERQQMAATRRRESLLVPLAYAAGSLAIVALLLGFCWYAVASDQHGTIDTQLNELLITEIVADEPRLLPSHRGTHTLLEKQDRSSR